MISHLRQLLGFVRKRPGMYGVYSYREMVAFVNGCDAATGGLMLEGFHEWLESRLGHASSLVWDRVNLELMAPDRDLDPRALDPDTESAAIAHAFDLLDAFLAIREQRGGLRRIYLDGARR